MNKPMVTATVYTARRQPLASRGTASKTSVSMDSGKIKTAFDSLGRPENLPDEIAQQLRARILNESLAPGQRLPTEQELGAQFGVSRNVVREAIARLKSAAEERGANAVVMMRFDSNSFASVNEVTAYGTAVFIEPIEK